MFESKLRYYDPQKATASYTGNISEWQWKRNNNTDDMYAFSYDKLSRLTEADHYQKRDSDAWGTTPLNAFAEKGLTYDLNSNIKSLKRYSGGVLADDLSYNYSGNLITTIDNSVNSNIEQYGYDANGNMKLDGLSGSQIRYNFLNLTSEVHNPDEVTKSYYTYLADGTKLGVKDWTT